MMIQSITFLDEIGGNINGMPITVLSDALLNTTSTLITVQFKEFVHPDFDLIENKIVYKNFKEKEALIGRKYYPHKDIIIENLRNMHKKGNLPFKILLDELNVDFISNYLVNYTDGNNKSFFHKVYTITNLKSYLKVKNRYYEKVSEWYNNEEIVSINKLLGECKIVNLASLQNFICGAIAIFKKQVELGGLYRYFWENNAPNKEPDNQPLIKGQLYLILEMKGIQISRESIVSNGALDFLCSYTHNGQLLKTCIELKHAHHTNLLHGLTSQLPTYMKGENTRQGIFLVLWFKCKDFGKPAEYENIEVLQKHLEENTSKKHKIKTVVIDCAKPQSPSKG